MYAVDGRSHEVLLNVQTLCLQSSTANNAQDDDGDEWNDHEYPNDGGHAA